MSETNTGVQMRAPQSFSDARTLSLLSVVAGAVLTLGCHGGVASPVGPSATSNSVPIAFSSAASMPGEEVVTGRAAPASYAMNEQSGSGYSGTCTVTSTHAGGIRLRAHGQGIPNTVIYFDLVNVSTTDEYRFRAIADVNQQGAFRTGWDAYSTPFPSNAVVECRITSYPDDALILAKSATFPAS